MNMAKKETKTNNLSLAKVKKVSKKIDETEVYIIEEGHYAGEQITFNPEFSEIKIKELLVELSNLFTEAEEKGIEVSQEMEIYITHLLIIKTFTHFKKDMPNGLVSEDKSVGLLDMLEHFEKTGLLDECLNNMFLPEEVRKVFDRATDFSARGLLAQDLNDEILTKFSDLKLKNRDLFEKLDSIKEE